MKTKSNAHITAPRIVGRKELSDILGVSSRTVMRLEEEGMPRLHTRIPTIIRYDLAHVLAWMGSASARATEVAGRRNAR